MICSNKVLNLSKLTSSERNPLSPTVRLCENSASAWKHLWAYRRVPNLLKCYVSYLLTFMLLKFTFSKHWQTPWTASRTFLAATLLWDERFHHLHDKRFPQNVLLSFVICNQVGQMKRGSCVFESRPKTSK